MRRLADRPHVERFREEVADRHQTDKIHLLFNNAGISGGGSMVTNSRDEWERTFNICWGGVYNCTRAFLPMLLVLTMWPSSAFCQFAP